VLFNKPQINIVRCHEATPKGGSKAKTAIFRVKLHFSCKQTVCYKVSECEYCQRQSCNALGRDA